MTWEIDYGASSLTAEVVNSPLPGDFDGDGDVDGEDFLDWQRHGLSTENLIAWQNHYGEVRGTLSAAGSSVPEPAGLTLLLGSVALHCSSASRKRLR